MVNVDDIDDAVVELTTVPRARTCRRADQCRAAGVAAVPVARLRPVLGGRTGSRDAAVAARRDRPGGPESRRGRVPPRREAGSAVGVRESGRPGPPLARRLHLLGGLRAVSGPEGRVGRARAGVDPVLSRSSRLHVHRSPAAGRSGSDSPIPTCSRATSSAATSSRRSSRTRTAFASDDVLGVETLHVGERLPPHRVDLPALAGRSWDGMVAGLPRRRGGCGSRPRTAHGSTGSTSRR